MGNSIIATTKLARKPLTFDKTGSCIKKERNPLFGVPMGSFDDAVVCEVVCLNLKDKLSTFLGSINVGLQE